MTTYQELEQRRLELQNLNQQIEQRYAGMVEGGTFTGSQADRASLEAQRSALAERERQIIEQQRRTQRAQQQLTVIERMKGKTGTYAPLVKIQERKAQQATKAGAEATEAYNKSVEDFNRKTQQVYESYQRDVGGLTAQGESFNQQVSDYNKQLEDEYNKQVQRQQEFGEYLQKVAEGKDAPQIVDVSFYTRSGRREPVFVRRATIDIPLGKSASTYGETADYSNLEQDWERLKEWGLEGAKKYYGLGPEDIIRVDGKVIQESSFTPEEISIAKQVLAGRTAALEQYKREQELEQDRLKTGWEFAQKDAAQLQSIYDRIATLAPTKQAEALKEQLKGFYAKEVVEGMRWEVGGVTFSTPAMAERYAGQLSAAASKQQAERVVQAEKAGKIPLFDETGKPAFVLEGPASSAPFKRDPKYGTLVHQDLYEDFGEKVTRRYNEIESDLSNTINESSYSEPVFTALRDVSRLAIPFGMTRTGTKMIESGVEELRVKPLTAMTNIAVAAFLTKGFGALAKIPEFAPAVRAAGYGLGSIYAADVAVRLAGAEDRVKEFGKIAYTELVPFAIGAKIGGMKLPRDVSIPSFDYSARSRALTDLLRGNIKKVDLRRVLSEHQYNNVEWQDYELWLKSGRIDVLERKYPTPEPAPAKRKTVDLSAELIKETPEEAVSRIVAEENAYYMRQLEGLEPIRKIEWKSEETGFYTTGTGEVVEVGAVGLVSEKYPTLRHEAFHSALRTSKGTSLEDFTPKERYIEALRAKAGEVNIDIGEIGKINTKELSELAQGEGVEAVSATLDVLSGRMPTVKKSPEIVWELIEEKLADVAMLKRSKTIDEVVQAKIADLETLPDVTELRGGYRGFIANYYNTLSFVAETLLLAGKTKESAKYEALAEAGRKKYIEYVYEMSKKPEAQEHITKQYGSPEGFIKEVNKLVDVLSSKKIIDVKSAKTVSATDRIQPAEWSQALERGNRLRQTFTGQEPMGSRGYRGTGVQKPETVFTGAEEKYAEALQIGAERKVTSFGSRGYKSKKGEVSGFEEIKAGLTDDTFSLKDIERLAERKAESNEASFKEWDRFLEAKRRTPFITFYGEKPAVPNTYALYSEGLQKLQPSPKPEPKNRLKTITAERSIVLDQFRTLMESAKTTARPRAKTTPAVLVLTKTKTQPKTQVKPLSFLKTLLDTEYAIKTATATQLKVLPQTQTRSRTLTATKTATRTATRTKVQELTQLLTQVQPRTKVQPQARTKLQLKPATITRTKVTTRTRTTTATRVKARMKTPKQFKDYIEKRRRGKSKYEWDIENPVPTLESLLGE